MSEEIQILIPFKIDKTKCNHCRIKFALLALLERQEDYDDAVWYGYMRQTSTNESKIFCPYRKPTNNMYNNWRFLYMLVTWPLRYFRAPLRPWVIVCNIMHSNKSSRTWPRNSCNKAILSVGERSHH